MWRPAKQDQRVQERDQAALVIRLQSGECVTSSESFASVAENDVIQRHAAAVVTDPPDDTASSLDPADPTKANFPQFGHGSIKLTVLFTDPTDLE